MTEDIPVEFIATVTELAGILTTAVGILLFVSTLLGGGYTVNLTISLIVTIAGMVVWWSGKKIREGCREGVIPLLLAVLATTPVDITDPVTLLLEVLALLALGYVYHHLR